jgi:hypothetical protein
MHCIACGKCSAMRIGTARDINVSLKPPAGGSMLPTRLHIDTRGPR